MLRVTDAQGHTDWTTQPVILPAVMQQAAVVASLQPGIGYTYYEGAWPALPHFDDQTPVDQGVMASPGVSLHKRASNYGFVFEGYLRVPASGGYSFSGLSRDGSRLDIEDTEVAHSPTPWPQVCGSVGNAVQAASGSVGLASGMHAIRIEVTQTTGEDAFDLLWQGPGIPLSKLPEGVLFHRTSP